MRVAVEPGPKGKRRQVTAISRCQPQRGAQPDLPSIVIDRDAKRTAKRAAKMEWRDSNAPRQFTHAEVVEEPGSNGGFRILDQVPSRATERHMRAR